MAGARFLILPTITVGPVLGRPRVHLCGGGMVVGGVVDGWSSFWYQRHGQGSIDSGKAILYHYSSHQIADQFAAL